MNADSSLAELFPYFVLYFFGNFVRLDNRERAFYVYVYVYVVFGSVAAHAQIVPPDDAAGVFYYGVYFVGEAFGCGVYERVYGFNCKLAADVGYYHRNAEGGDAVGLRIAECSRYQTDQYDRRAQYVG